MPVHPNSIANLKQYKNKIGNNTRFNDNINMSFFQGMIDQKKLGKAGILYSLQYETLTELYENDGVIRNIVNKPVDIGFTKYNLQSADIDNDEKKQLEQQILYKDINEKVKLAFKQKRLYGGAAMIIDTGDNLAEPLLLYKGCPYNLINCNRWQIAGADTGGLDTQRFFYVAGDMVHCSRVILIKETLPSFLTQQKLAGWGLSCLESLIDKSNSYQLGLKVVYELMSEAKIDVYSISDYNTLNEFSKNAVLNKVQIANMLKNYLNAIVIDKEDVYAQKGVSFSNIPELIRELKYEISADVDIPLSIIYGLMSNGMGGGTGKEFDILQFYNSLQTIMQPQFARVIHRITEGLMLSLWGNVYDLEVNFDNVELQTSQEKEQQVQSEFIRLDTLLKNNVINIKEYLQQLQEVGVINDSVAMSEDERYYKDINAQPVQQEIRENEADVDIDVKKKPYTLKTE